MPPMRRRGTAGARPAAGPTQGVVEAFLLWMLRFRRGAGDGCGGHSAVTVCGNEAASLEPARGGGWPAASARRHGHSRF